jgi:DNA-binding FadR family transcriptional regulator
MNGGPDNTPPMMSLDRYSPIVDAIEKGDVPAAVAVVEEHTAAAAEHFADARDAD